MKWLHLSDLHYLYKNYETDVMRDSFITYLDETFSGTIDILFITGDFAHRGSDYTEDLFIFLESILKSLGIEKSSVFIVPGNHDVKRDEIAELIIDSIINNENARKKINELGEKPFRSLYSGQKAFIEFYEKFLEREYPKDDLHFFINHKDVNILHINTCLVAGADDVEGKILVGLDKLYATLKKLDKSKITFALGHHTLNCLHKDEIETFKNRLSDSCIDFYLCGHVHKTNLGAVLDNFNATYVFTCGANVVDEYSDPVFIEGEFDITSTTAKVNYHKWHQENEFWYIDNSLDRRLRNGYFEFGIDKLKKKTKSLNKKSNHLNENKFKSFLIKFIEILDGEKPATGKFVKKDVNDKFTNMLCSKSFQIDFDKQSIYFPIINEIYNTSAFVSFEGKDLISSLISRVYRRNWKKCEDGDDVFDRILQTVVEEYINETELSLIEIEKYISILIYWGIHECDIYNETIKKGVS